MASENPTDRSHAQPDQQQPRTWQELVLRIIWPLDRPWKIIIAIAIGLALVMIAVWAALPESSREQVFSSIFSQNPPPPKSSPPKDTSQSSQDGAEGGGETKPGKVATKFKNPGSMRIKLIVKDNNGVSFFSTEIAPGSEVTIYLSPGDYAFYIDTGVTLAVAKPCYTFKRDESGKFTVKERTQKSIDLPAIGVVKIPHCKPTLRPTLRK